LIALARSQPQTEAELMTESLPKPKQSAQEDPMAELSERGNPVTELSERWLIKSNASGYFIPHDSFRRWIRLNYLGEL
jgi:hypothetical protein